MLAKLIIGFLCFLILVYFIELVRKRRSNQKPEAKKTLPEPGNACNEDEYCCGQHESCEKIDAKKKVKENIEYYDDEELDIYQSRSSDSYTDSEIQEFREIVHSMWPHEVKGWLESLEKRGIELPDQLKKEVSLIIDSK